MTPKEKKRRSFFSIVFSTILVLSLPSTVSYAKDPASKTPAPLLTEKKKFSLGSYTTTQGHTQQPRVRP